MEHQLTLNVDQFVVTNPMDISLVPPGSTAVIRTHKILDIDYPTFLLITGGYSPSIHVYGTTSDIVVDGDSTPVIWVSTGSFMNIHAKGNSRVTIVSESPNVSLTLEDNAKAFGYSDEEYKVKVLQGQLEEIETAKDWCEFYNVPVINGIALLAKGVNSDYNSFRDNLATGKLVSYAPGTIPVAEDWDGGDQECGKGLHFSPNLRMVNHFAYPGRRLACPVKLTDLSVHPKGEFPSKCKAKGCCEPVWEVDDYGYPIDEKNQKIYDEFFMKHGGK